MRCFMFARRRGISFIEAMVVILIALILIGLLLPKLQRVPDGGGARGETHNNLKQLSIAAANAEGAYRALPPAYGKYGAAVSAQSALVHLLPFMEQSSLYGNLPELEKTFIKSL